MPLITHAVLLHRDSLHGDTFAQREMPFYTQTLLQRDDFTLRKEYVHEGFLATGIFTQTCYWIISCGGTLWRKEFSKHMQNHSFTTVFDGRGAFRGKRLAQDKPTLHFDLNVWRMTFRAKRLRFVDINQPTLPCRSNRKVRNNQGCRCL